MPACEGAYKVFMSGGDEAADKEPTMNDVAFRWYDTFSHDDLAKEIRRMAGKVFLDEHHNGGFKGCLLALREVIARRAAAYVNAGSTVDYRPLLVKVNKVAAAC